MMRSDEGHTTDQATPHTTVPRGRLAGRTIHRHLDVSNGLAIETSGWTLSCQGYAHTQERRSSLLTHADRTLSFSLSSKEGIQL
jgi:hypothetical protein